jgi:hypothetical protein
MHNKENYTVKKIRSVEIASLVASLGEADREVFFSKHIKFATGSFLISIATLLLSGAVFSLMCVTGVGLPMYFLVLPLMLGVAAASWREFWHRWIFIIQNRDMLPKSPNNHFIKLLLEKR